MANVKSTNVIFYIFICVLPMQTILTDKQTDTRTKTDKPLAMGEQTDTQKRTSPWLWAKKQTYKNEQAPGYGRIF